MKTKMKIKINKLAHNLPEDVIEEILVRLPASSLVQLKRVSKSWKSLISDQRFIHNHLQIHSRKPDHNLVLRWTRWFGVDEKRQQKLQLANVHVLSLLTANDNTRDSGSISSSSSGSSIREIFAPITPEWEFHPEAMQLFHCNGIICTVDVVGATGNFYESHSQRIAFFNPVKQCKIVKTPTSALDFRCSRFGFEYDSKSCRYKCVRILTPVDESFRVAAEVLTLGINGWRVIKLGTKIAPLRGRGAYRNGFYYWLYCAQDGCEWILSFDMSEDKFTSFAAPHVADSQEWPDILVHGESLVYFCFPTKRIIETWVMDNNAKEEVVWNKYHTIAGRGLGKPLSFWKKDELLMEAKDGRLVSYHLRTKKLSTVSIDGGRMRCSTVARFESLISVF